MFIIDFDDTIFDTHAFKKMRVDVLSPLGVDFDLHMKTYTDARNTPDGLCSYSNRRHAEVLGLHGFDEDQIFHLLEQTTVPAQLKNFLIAGAEVFLQQLKSFGDPMILLTHGVPNFQELKVKGSGVDSYFDRMFMVEETKADVLRELFENIHESKAWFINDKVQETIDLLKIFPQMNAVLKVSPNVPIEEYKKSRLPHFATLPEIESYVRSKRT